MTRLFLAAGVAALAIATPAAAKPGDHGGGQEGGGHAQPQAQHGGGGGGGGQHFGGAPHGGGGGGGPSFQAQAYRGGGGGGSHVQMQAYRGGGGGPRFQAQAYRGGGGGPRFQSQAYRGGGGGPRFQSQAYRGGGGPRFQSQAYRGGGGRYQGVSRQAEARGRNFAPRAQRGGRAERLAMQRGQSRQRFAMQRQSQSFTRQHGGRQMASGRSLQREQLRGNRFAQARNQSQSRMNAVRQAQNGRMSRQQMRAGGLQGQQQAFANRAFNARQLSGRNFNSQALAANGQFAGNGTFARNQQLALQQTVNTSNASALRFGRSAQILPVSDVQRFVGSPLSVAGGFAAFGPLPASVSYLYPPTPDYYYQFGDGYVYQIDRTDNIIAALIPLLAGGYLPGQYLPGPYMASYVPDSYGFNAFYPDYGDVCNRYAYGVVYQVDCYSGMVEDVIPVYASGYGVGQILPDSYAYYNVPYQYRRLYYDTPDYNYWYAPGAIYQYDPRSSMITSVAALLSPGFAVGQALPLGYDVYNVPYAYRSTYYDTPSVWYRYNNGYIYQVDPATRLVTAAVASLLT